MGQSKTESSSFVDYWYKDRGELDGGVFEIIYTGKRINDLNVGFAISHTGIDAFNQDVIVNDDYSDLDVSIIALGPEITYQHYFNPVFGIYGRGGVDLYHLNVAYRYESSDLLVEYEDVENTLGGHIAIGGRYVFFKDLISPKDRRVADVAYSLFAEIGYRYGSFSDVDKEFTKQLNREFGYNIASHDFDPSGINFRVGLSTHF